MKYYLFIFFIMMICTYSAHAADTRYLSVKMEIEQDTLRKAKQSDKKASENEILPQAEDALIKVPKAKNKAIPRPVIMPAININSPRIAPIKIKVKVNTQVKIKL